MIRGREWQRPWRRRWRWRRRREEEEVGAVVGACRVAEVWTVDRLIGGGESWEEFPVSYCHGRKNESTKKEMEGANIEEGMKVWIDLILG